MAECQCRFCFEKYPVPSLTRFCEETHLDMIQDIPRGMQISVRSILIKTPVGWLLTPITLPGIGPRELKEFIGGELTTRIEKAVLGTRHYDHIKSRRIWWRWENPNLQDIPVLISLGIPPKLLEDIERVERGCEWRPQLRLQGLSSEPEKVIVKLM